MKKKKTPVYIVGGLCVALLALMIILTAIIASGSFHLRKTQIVIRTGSDEKEYDGKPLTCDEWILEKGTLAKEHTLYVEVRGEQTRAGVSDNVADVVIYDRGGMDVSDQYDIVIDAGKLEVTKRKLTVESYSSSRIYDGSEFTHEQAKLAKGRISKGHHLTTTDFITVKEPGVYQNTFTAMILDDEGNDVSDRYDITYVYGEIVVKYGTLYVVSGSSSKEYDGMPLSDPSCKLEEGKLADGHQIKMEATGSITTVGQCPNSVSVKVFDKGGADVTNRYEIVLGEGLLSITPRHIVIRTKDVRRKLDDSADYNDWEIVEGEIVPGDSITVRTAQQTHDRDDGPGSFDNLIVYTNISSLDRVGELSNCYRIVAKCGRYEITE